MEIDRLGFVHENYFVGNAPVHSGKLIYEISFYFYMKVPEDFSPKNNIFMEEYGKEYLKWISPDDERTIYPDFFRTELIHPKNAVQYFITDGR